MMLEFYLAENGESISINLDSIVSVFEANLNGKNVTEIGVVGGKVFMVSDPQRGSTNSVKFRINQQKKGI